MRGTRGGGVLQKMLESQVIDFQKAASEIVIYNKKYIYIYTFGLHPIPGTELLKSWDFPSDK